jgi:hypothetical protein
MKMRPEEYTFYGIRFLFLRGETYDYLFFSIKIVQDFLFIYYFFFRPPGINNNTRTYISYYNIQPLPYNNI